MSDLTPEQEPWPIRNFRYVEAENARLRDALAKAERERDMYEVDSAGLRSVCRALADRFPAAETMAASEAIHALADRVDRVELERDALRELRRRSTSLARVWQAEGRAEAAERERDDWKRRRDNAVETCRFRHQDGLTAEEWHTNICGAMQGAMQERARAEQAERESMYRGQRIEHLEQTIARVESVLAAVQARAFPGTDAAGNPWPAIVPVSVVREALRGAVGDGSAGVGSGSTGREIGAEGREGGE